MLVTFLLCGTFRFGTTLPVPCCGEMSALVKQGDGPGVA